MSDDILTPPRRRIDWVLVRPPQAGAVGVFELARQIDDIVKRASEELLSQSQLTLLRDLEDRHDRATVSPCEASKAPRFGDDPDWESRALDEYAEADVDLELEAFMELRRTEPDCERCPYASPYSVYPSDPCEFSAGGLLTILPMDGIPARILQPMGPAEMRILADRIEGLYQVGETLEYPGIDEGDYITKAVFFLRFWADHGFGIKPDAPDEVPPVVTPNGDPSGSDPSETPPVLH